MTARLIVTLLIKQCSNYSGFDEIKTKKLQVLHNNVYISKHNYLLSYLTLTLCMLMQSNFFAFVDIR